MDTKLILTSDRSAVISPCGKYRYILMRNWDIGKKGLTFVMLNPSTADADLDDPTIRRCIGFAKAMDYGCIYVINLFALRSTDPKALLERPENKAELVGPENEQYIDGRLRAAQDGLTDVVVAWGAHRSIGLLPTYFTARARMAGVKLHCLGKTRDGHPRHPLYVKRSQTLERYA